MDLCACPRDHLCEPCFRRTFAQLGGTAGARGINWAERVARTRDRRRPWWPHEGRAAELAREHVLGLTGDPRLLEALAAECAKTAKHWWERLARQPGEPAFYVGPRPR